MMALEIRRVLQKGPREVPVQWRLCQDDKAVRHCYHGMCDLDWHATSLVWRNCGEVEYP